MQLKSHHVRLASLAAMAIGVVVIIATGLTMWLGGSSDDDKRSSPDDLGRSLQPLDPGLDASENPEKIPSDDKVSSSLKAGGADPFADGSTDRTVHKVVIRFTSDGAMYAGWRYRTKGGDGLKVAGRTLEVSKTVRGSLPVAQAAVQALQTATYATCTIIVDGVAVTTQTAKGTNHVTVCVG